MADGISTNPQIAEHLTQISGDIRTSINNENTVTLTNIFDSQSSEAPSSIERTKFISELVETLEYEEENAELLWNVLNYDDDDNYFTKEEFEGWLDYLESGEDNAFSTIELINKISENNGEELQSTGDNPAPQSEGSSEEEADSSTASVPGEVSSDSLTRLQREGLPIEDYEKRINEDGTLGEAALEEPTSMPIPEAPNGSGSADNTGALEQIKGAIGNGIGKNGLTQIMPEDAPDFTTADKVSTRAVLQAGYLLLGNNSKTFNELIKGPLTKEALNSNKQQIPEGTQLQVGDIVFAGKDGTLPCIITEVGEEGISVVQGGLSQNGVQNGIFINQISLDSISGYIPTGQEAAQAAADAQAAAVAEEATEEAPAQQEAQSKTEEAEAETQTEAEIVSDANRIKDKINGIISGFLNTDTTDTTDTALNVLGNALEQVAGEVGEIIVNNRQQENSDESPTNTDIQTKSGAAAYTYDEQGNITSFKSINFEELLSSGVLSTSQSSFSAVLNNLGIKGENITYSFDGENITVEIPHETTDENGKTTNTTYSNFILSKEGNIVGFNNLTRNEFQSLYLGTSTDIVSEEARNKILTLESQNFYGDTYNYIDGTIVVAKENGHGYGIDKNGNIVSFKNVSQGAFSNPYTCGAVSNKCKEAIEALLGDTINNETQFSYENNIITATNENGHNYIFNAEGNIISFSSLSFEEFSDISEKLSEDNSTLKELSETITALHNQEIRYTGFSWKPNEEGIMELWATDDNGEPKKLFPV